MLKAGGGRSFSVRPERPNAQKGPSEVEYSSTERKYPIFFVGLLLFFW